MTQCFINDRGILPYIDNTRSEDLNAPDPELPDTWEISQICTNIKEFNEINGLVYNLQTYIDNAEYWGTYELHYRDENNHVIEVDENQLRQVATMWMPYYDTRYRINIFDTIDGYLLLGINESD